MLRNFSWLRKPSTSPVSSSAKTAPWLTTELSAFPVPKNVADVRSFFIETDASRMKGLGFLLFQQQPDGSRRVVQAGSRLLTECEARYAVIKLELLAVAWVVWNCRPFLSGLHYQTVSDHRPLVAILNSKTLDEIENLRLQRLRQRIGKVGSYTATWRPGSMHHAPDALSRAPSESRQRRDDIGEDADAPSVSSIVGMEVAATNCRLRHQACHTTAIANITRCCTSCQRELPNQQQETMMRRPPVEKLFQELHIDFADHAGRKYLVAVDEVYVPETTADPSRGIFARISPTEREGGSGRQSHFAMPSKPWAIFRTHECLWAVYVFSVCLFPTPSPRSFLLSLMTRTQE